MKKETEFWIAYADDNIKSSAILLKNNLFTPSLHNMQQSIEKYLKAVLLEKTGDIKRTHSIREIVDLLADLDFNIDISDDETDLIDSIYLPSKYPIGGALPDFFPDNDFCIKCLNIAEKVKKSVILILCR